MSQQNVDAARGTLEAWNRRDPDGLLEACHPEVEWHSAIKRRVEGADTVFRGHDGLRQFWEEWHAVWDLTLDVSEFRDLGDTVVGLGTMRTRGEASGVEVESPVGYVFEFEDGLIRTIRAYLDRQEALGAVGLRG